MKIKELLELLKLLEKLEKEPDFEEFFDSDIYNLKDEINIYIDFLGEDEEIINNENVIYNGVEYKLLSTEKCKNKICFNCEKDKKVGNNE